jgi:hypothetical protein
MVRKGGLEPPHLSVPDPKSGASANSATFAIAIQITLNITSFYRAKTISLHPKIVLMPLCEGANPLGFWLATRSPVGSSWC